jgi:hypothetical protein
MIEASSQAKRSIAEACGSDEEITMSSKGKVPKVILSQSAIS